MQDGQIATRKTRRFIEAKLLSKKFQVFFVFFFFENNNK